MRVTEEKAAEERKQRIKHQDLEESLRVTIQQLQAKISQMNSITSPLYVENLEKKLSNSKAEIKKMKCELEYKRSKFIKVHFNLEIDNIKF